MQDPRVPETLEGWSVLHQVFRVRWAEWKRLSADARRDIATTGARLLEEMEKGSSGPSAAVSLLGHKGDLMLIHFRRDFEDLNDAQLGISQTDLGDYLEPASSYVSVLELGLYEMTVKLHQDLSEKGLEPGREEFVRAFGEEMARQRERMKGRLFPEIPKRRHVCFYPMNKRRGETKNWYSEPIQKRAEMMREHGFIGRRFTGEVTQIISGSIGFDDWEWGVDLFADDPLVFKKLIYEMRFDEASAVYAEFGPFFVGLQFSGSDLPRLLVGQTPALHSGGG